MLSASFDWTIKLWNLNTKDKEKQCVQTFQFSEDYVYDVAWNPKNPAVFASADG